MYPKKSVLCAVSSRISIFLFSIFIIVFSVIQTTDLQAAGWGKTKEAFEHEGTMWNKAYLDLEGLHVVASIPNYSSGRLFNDTVSLHGQINKDIGYVVETTYNTLFNPPESIQEFIQIIQENNPDHSVNEIDSKKQGAAYAVDLIPLNQEYKTYGRYLFINDRLVTMVTEDVNENRRLYFFDSLHKVSD
jgi:hypothetical protein